MKPVIGVVAAVMLTVAVPAYAAQPVTRFKDWAASSYRQNGHRICYSFTQAILGRKRRGGCNTAVLVVTHAPPRQDRVVVSPCHPYAPHQAALTMTAGTRHFAFHPSGKYAYAAAGPATVAAFRREMKATLPAPQGRPKELFSLRGFSAAYDAMRSACIG
ncbi:hypothetical protein ACELLULO517_08730 [Acidisoma cellulosilytica]|uniref:Uncharacterized protein n=1 Tax=Acidisoma cellulosilyticum TaxID=2802395 RepID=A0A963Z086_9PROT|nr:lactonase family protein [Acidisoma cellulosilyticum]MCB8880315.1 hypothetical protein [Acidisoma cellulosilyticum]